MFLPLNHHLKFLSLSFFLSFFFLSFFLSFLAFLPLHFLYLFVTGFHVVQAGLELLISCFYLPGTGITDGHAPPWPAPPEISKLRAQPTVSQTALDSFGS